MLPIRSIFQSFIIFLYRFVRMLFFSNGLIIIYVNYVRCKTV